jgi:hypothetical protein
MQAVLLKILVTLGTQLLTAKFLSRMIVLGLRSLAKVTDNNLDDSMVDEIAKALDCEDLVVGSKK